MTRTKSTFLALLAILLSPMAANADLIDFDLEWSGASFDNTAVATGSITIDDDILLNPGYNDSSIDAWVTDFSITVTESGSGNGTWGLSDFGFIIWWADVALDLTQELVGQAQLTDPWGTSQPGATGGDFNMFPATPEAPFGSYYFQITTFSGDDLLLTSFRPSAVPEPGTLALLGIGLFGMGLTRRRKV